MEVESNVNNYKPRIEYAKTRYPLVWLCLAFILGLFLGRSCEIAPYLYTAGILILITSFLIWLVKRVHKKNVSLFPMILVLTLLAGYYRMSSLLHKPTSMNYPLKGQITKVREQRSRIRYRLETPNGSVYAYASKKVKRIPNGAIVRFFSRVRAFPSKGFPSLFDYDLYKWVHNLRGMVFLSKKQMIDPIVMLPSQYRAFISNLQRIFKERLQRSFKEEHSALLGSILLGNKSGMSRSQRAKIAQIGLAHILVVSGLHLGIWVAALYFLVRFFPLARWLKVLIILITCWILVEICGRTYPLLRAFTMACFFLLSLLVQRRSHGINLLAGAALLILIFMPKSFWDLSFRLSFLATFGIIFFVPFVHAKLIKIGVAKRSRILLFSLDALSVSVSAQLVLSVVLLSTFGRISLIAPLVNMVQIPLVNLLTISGYAFLIFEPLPIVGTSLATLLKAFLWLWDLAISLWSQFAFLAYLRSVYDPIAYALITALLFLAVLWRFDLLTKLRAAVVSAICLIVGLIVFHAKVQQIPIEEIWLWSYRRQLSFVRHWRGGTLLYAPKGVNPSKLRAFLHYKGWRNVSCDCATRRKLPSLRDVELTARDNLPKSNAIVTKWLRFDLADRDTCIISIRKTSKNSHTSDKLILHLYPLKKRRHNVLSLADIGPVGFLIYEDRVELHRGRCSIVLLTKEKPSFFITLDSLLHRSSLPKQRSIYR